MKTGYSKMTNKLGAVQGDVPVFRVKEIPSDAVLTERRIVAYGEKTGHNHQLVGVDDAYENEEGLWFVVSKSADLVHTSNGEHGVIEIKPGLYFIPRIPQVEYDGEKEMRVAD